MVPQMVRPGYLCDASSQDLDPLRDERVAVGEFSKGPAWQLGVTMSKIGCVGKHRLITTFSMSDDVTCL